MEHVQPQKQLMVLKEKIRESRAFSLMEMIVLIIFLSVSLTAIVNLYSTAMLGSTESYLVSQATILAQSKLEDVISDRNRQDRGYAYIVVPDTYPSETFGLFTITTTIEPENHEYHGVDYVLITAEVTHAGIEPIKLSMWLTQD